MSMELQLKETIGQLSAALRQLTPVAGELHAHLKQANARLRATADSMAAIPKASATVADRLHGLANAVRASRESAGRSGSNVTLLPQLGLATLAPASSSVLGTQLYGGLSGGPAVTALAGFDRPLTSAREAGGVGSGAAAVAARRGGLFAWLLDDRLVAEVQQRSEQLFQTLRSGFETFSRSIITGTERIGDAFRQMASNVAVTFVNMLTEMGTRWLVMRAAMLGGGLLFGGRGFGGGLLGSVGDLLSFGRGGLVPSAAGGMVVGGSATPALLHPREMVLPAPLSAGIQRMVAAGTAPSQGHHVSVSYHVNALDARSVRSLLEEHGGTIVNLIRRELRNSPGVGV